MAADKVLLEILNNRFTGIVEEMGYVIHRASFTVFVKETWDFDSALITPEGEMFCYPAQHRRHQYAGDRHGPGD